MSPTPLYSKPPIDYYIKQPPIDYYIKQPPIDYYSKRLDHSGASQRTFQITRTMKVDLLMRRTSDAENQQRDEMKRMRPKISTTRIK
jgi:hypothetical protein